MARARDRNLESSSGVEYIYICTRAREQRIFLIRSSFVPEIACVYYVSLAFVSARRAATGASDAACTKEIDI